MLTARISYRRPLHPAISTGSRTRDPEAFKGWFYKTLSRTAWRVCRKARREQPAEEVYPEEKEAPGGLLSRVILKEEEQALYREILRLPVKQRTVIILYYYNGMTIKEIAAACGCLEGTVKSRLFHGKARLKEALTKQDQKEAPHGRSYLRKKFKRDLK